MLIAAIRSGDALAGKAVSYSEDDGRFWLTGVGEIDPAKLLEYDAQGQIDWADDATRNWVIELASGASPPPPPTTPPASEAAPEVASEAAPAAAPTTPSGGPTASPRLSGSELEPDEDPGLATAPPATAPLATAPPATAPPATAPPATAPPATTAPPSAAGAPTTPSAAASPEGPIAVTAAQNLRRVRQPRPEAVEGKKGLSNLSEAQKRMIAFGAIGLVMVAAIVLLGVWGRGGDAEAPTQDDTEYAEIFSTNSDDALRTIDFEITSERQRVEYTVSPADPGRSGSYSIALVPATSANEGDLEYVVVNGNVAAGTTGTTDSVDTALEPGSYHLRVVQSNSAWSVTVFQATE